jgi:pilus assembly protein CpaB
MGNPKAFIPILLSIVIALGGSYFLYQWVKDKTAPGQVVTVKETKAEMLTTKPYLEESLPKEHFTRPEDLENRIVVSHIREGEPVLEYRLAPTTLETGGGFSCFKQWNQSNFRKGQSCAWNCRFYQSR